MEKLPPPSTVISALKILTSPNKINIAADSQTPTVLDILLVNIDALTDSMKTEEQFTVLLEAWEAKSDILINTKCSSRWRFIQYCLKALSLLNKSLVASLKEFEQITQSLHANKSAVPPMSPDTLSFDEQKIVKRTIQFIVCLGMCPNFEQGVGFPMELRTDFSDLVKVLDNNGSESEPWKDYQLFSCVQVLMSCVNNSALATIILTQHLPDILAALLQLNYRGMTKFKQNKNKLNNETSNSNTQGHDIEKTSEQNLLKHTNATTDDCVGNENTNSTGNASNIEQDGSFTPSPDPIFLESSRAGTIESSNIVNTENYIFCKNALGDLIKKVYPPLLVRTLTLLQGGPKPKNVINKKQVLHMAPVWLRRECGRQLSAIIMRPKGVQSVLRGMLDAPGAGKGMTEASDWQKCDAVGKVIACCPLQSQSMEKYYVIVAPQILELLHIMDKQVCRQFLRVACSTISHMCSQNAELARKYLVEPMIAPLTLSTTFHDKQAKELQSGDVLVDEQHLSQCIEDCHKVFVCGCSDRPDLITYLQPVIVVLYKLLVFTRRGVSTLSTSCEELVIAFLKQAELSVTLTCLKVITFQSSTDDRSHMFPTMQNVLKFAHSSNGNVEIVTDFSNTVHEGDDDGNVECILAVLKQIQSTGAAGDFLLYMLQELTAFIQCEVGEDTEIERQVSLSPRTEGQGLMDIERNNLSAADTYNRRLTLLNVLASACEILGPSCIKNAQNTLLFVKTTLERGIQICKSSSDTLFGMFENETMTMAMGLLTALMTGAFQLRDTDKQCMEELMPLLKEIGENHPQSTVRDMATDIRIAIATHGAVWSQLSKDKGRKFKETTDKVQEASMRGKELPQVPKIEVLSNQAECVAPRQDSKPGKNLESSDVELPNPSQDLSQHNTVMTDGVINEVGLKGDSKCTTQIGTESGSRDIGHQVAHAIGSGSHTQLSMLDEISDKTAGLQVGKEQSETELETELNMSFKELCDPLIPVRGHGLIRLTQLVSKRYKTLDTKASTILKIFEENLDHGDSYIYLSAVNGLSAMCDVYPEMTVPRVCQAFMNCEEKHGDSQGKTQRKKTSPELRMKLGEIMVKAARCLGDTIGQYGNILLRSALVGVRDDDALVRASSFSNLGELCKCLRFSLGNVLHEVFECCSGSVKYDADVQVRKAAAQAITLLLQGMGQDSIKILESILRDLYRLLKLVMASEKDEGVRLHVHLALNELDDIMREHLFPKQKLEKRIRVLDFE